MEIKRIELMPDVWLTAIRTRKFKTSSWSLQLLAPLKKETAAMNALLPYVLRCGTARLPDEESINAELEMLYGGQIEPTVTKQGDMQCMGFFGQFLDDSLAPAGADLLHSAAILMGELLLHPATKNGRLRQDYLLAQRDKLLEQMNALNSNQAEQARQGLLKKMFAGSDYALSAYGATEQLTKISPPKIFAQYRAVLEQAPVELFYCGSAPAEQVELAWREALMGLPRAPRRYLVATDSHRTPFESVQRYQETAPNARDRMALGFRIGFGMSDALFPALLIADAMFGGALTGRLHRLSLAEGSAVTSELRWLKGLLIIDCAVPKASFETVRDEILLQLDDLQEGRFTTEEVETARNAVLNRISAEQDDLTALRSQWLRDRAGGEAFEIDRFYQQVQDVAESQVSAAAMELVLYDVYELTGEEGAEK